MKQKDPVLYAFILERFILPDSPPLSGLGRRLSPWGGLRFRRAFGPLEDLSLFG